MTDDSPENPQQDFGTDSRVDLEPTAVTSSYKVLGQLNSDTGVGVLGQNDAGSGTPKGVEGAVPNATGSGYGLYTDHNAAVAGTLELGTLGGSILGGGTVDDLTGPGLATASNALRIGSGAITTGMLGQNGASDGQSFVWDGSSWTTGDVSGSSKWADSDGNGLLEPSGSETGIEVTDVRTDTLSDNGSGAVSVGAPVDLGGNDLVDSGTTVWDAANGYVPQSQLQNEAVTVAGNTVSLGGSTGIDHADLAGIGSADHHTRPSAGDGLTESLGDFDIEPADFAGTALEDDGSNNLAVGSDAIGISQLNTPFSTLSDLFGFPIDPGGKIETTDSIEAPLGNVLRLRVYARGLAIVNASEDIPSEGGGKSAPNVVAGAHNHTDSGSPRGATICGGGASDNPNVATANHATVCGGEGNEARGTDAITVGGEDNLASGSGAFAAGDRAAAEDGDAFVFNDGSTYHSISTSSLDGLSSSSAVNGESVTGQKTFSVSASGGVRFITSGSEVVYTTDGSAGWSMTSTRSAKTNFEPIDSADVLEGVEDMEVQTWEYRDEEGDGKGVTHIGPTAEGFHDVVDVGDSDEHINSVNADGLAFAAIQGLADRLKERDERIAELEADSEDLSAENDRLRERVEDLETDRDALAAENGRLRDRVEDLDARVRALEGEAVTGQSPAD